MKLYININLLGDFETYIPYIIILCAKTYSNRFAYICFRDKSVSLLFLVIEKGLCQWTVFILPLSTCPLDLRAIFYRRLLTSKALERNIYKISRNPNAQFSASIFSGIRSTYIIFSPIASCKWNIRT